MPKKKKAERYNGTGLHDWRNIKLYAHVMGKPLDVFRKYMMRRDIAVSDKYNP